ncbi:MAG: hypothetical protein V3R30_14420 [Kiloniellales bacterium]
MTGSIETEIVSRLNGARTAFALADISHLTPVPTSILPKCWLEGNSQKRLTTIIACTNCGMAPLPRHVAAGKLKALGAGATLLRKELGGS